MPPISRVISLRIECVTEGCRAQVIYQLKANSPLPVECPSCKTPWNKGLQQFRDAVMEHAGPGNGGNRYLLHLDFGDKEPFTAVIGRGL